VAIDGAHALIGAIGDDDMGSLAGAAYLFDISTGQQVHKLLAEDGAQFDHFGVSVAIDGSYAAVGADSDDDLGNSSGSAYVFDTATGNQLHKLLPDSGDDNTYFGKSIDISGTVVIVGAPYDNSFAYEVGAAYLFDANTGQQLRRLLPDDGESGDYFGWSVAIEGSVAAVGAYGDDDAGDLSGSVYLFDVNTGQQIDKFTAEDGTPSDAFGRSVDMDANVVIVSAHGDDDQGLESGAAYLFGIATGDQLAKYVPDDGAADDSFGSGVGVCGGVAIVGASGNDDLGDASGSAYICRKVPDPSCPWDLTSLDGVYNGAVDAFDFFALLQSWGACAAPPEHCPLDTTGDGGVPNGEVDVFDFFALLQHWGECP
jgi:hypothetical protein